MSLLFHHSTAPFFSMIYTTTQEKELLAEHNAWRKGELQSKTNMLFSERKTSQDNLPELNEKLSLVFSFHLYSPRSFIMLNSLFFTTVVCSLLFRIYFLYVFNYLSLVHYSLPCLFNFPHSIANVIIHRSSFVVIFVFSPLRVFRLNPSASRKPNNC